VENERLEAVCLVHFHRGIVGVFIPTQRVPVASSQRKRCRAESCVLTTSENMRRIDAGDVCHDIYALERQPGECAFTSFTEECSQNVDGRGRAPTVFGRVVAETVTPHRNLLPPLYLDCSTGSIYTASPFIPLLHCCISTNSLLQTTTTPVFSSR
jgi:hypothetical protein